MADLLSLTNIPTPYRTHFYNALASSLRGWDLSMRVVFMAYTETGRHWSVQPETWQFDGSFPRGIHPTARGLTLHLNLGIVRDLWLHPPRWLLLSGSWFMPTILLALATSKVKRIKTLFWSESNLTHVERRSGLTGRWRTRIMDAFDGYVVPGQWAREYVQQYAPSASAKPIIELPNIVDEERFGKQVSALRLERERLVAKWNLTDSPHPVLLTIARLEPIKGVRELIQAILTAEGLKSTTLLIAGTGSLFDELDSSIRGAGAESRLRLLGYQDEAEVLELLAISDGFILPSIGDPYPLAVIEALFAGLPLLLSNRVGCHPEALIPGDNGWLFDPLDAASIQNTLFQFQALDSDAYRQLGDQSRQLASARFGTERVVTRFIEGLIRI